MKKKYKKSPRPNTYNHTKTRNKKPKPRHRSTKDYDFLTYIRIVFRWATENHDLTRHEIELLLYLYPRGTFIKSEFYDYHKTYGIFQIKTWQKFLKENWMVEWRAGKRGVPAMYVLSSKAKILCSKMHKFCTGDLRIPMDRRSNKVGTSDKIIDGYFFKYMKEMNKQRDERLKEEKELIIEVEVDDEEEEMIE